MATQLNIRRGQTWKKEWINGGPTKWGGAGLDKDIVNINENYINYIQSNPELVQTVDDLEVAETGKTGHYFTLYLPWKNKQLAVNPLPIQITNREIITSTHTALLSQQELPIQARKSHPFPGLNEALLYIGTLCDHGCQATFDDKSILILNKGSGKVIMKGTRYPRSNLYMLNLTQQNKLKTDFKTPDEYFAGSAYEWKLKGTLVDYHQTSCWRPNQSGWGKEITKNYSLIGQAYHLTWCRNIYKKKINYTWAPSAT